MQTGGYSDNQSLGIEGQIASTQKTDMRSLKNSESAGVGFGLGVVDKGDGTFEELDALTKSPSGVLAHSHAYDNADMDPAGVPAKQAGDVVERGELIVYPETAVSAGDDAFCRFANGVADAALVTKGKWRNDSDTYTAMHVNRAKFKTAAAAGKPAILKLLDGFGEPDLVVLHRDIPAVSATTTLELGAVPANRHVKVRSASLSCGVTAEDATNKYVIELRAAATVLASHNSDAAAQGAVVQNTHKAMVLTAGARGKHLERLSLVFTKSGTAANITAGSAMVELEVY